jgi:hypothetical protein
MSQSVLADRNPDIRHYININSIKSKIRKTTINGIGNPVHGLGQAQNGGGVKPVNGP